MKKLIALSPFVALCGASLLVYSILYLKGEESWGQSPALFCLVCGGVLVALSPFLRDGAGKRAAIEIQKLLAQGLLTVGYCALLGRVHFVVITAVFLFALSVVTQKRGAVDSVIYSVSAAFFVYLVFSVGFGIAL
ncbi:MAG: tripartite tricarboxylate transporter TctB family protein [Oscillospiraceae bacterium]